jgi:hypothetical protein
LPHYSFPMEYSIKLYSISLFQKLLYYILKQDRNSAVDDAMEVIKVFDNVNEEMVYMFRIRFLVKNDRVSTVILNTVSKPFYW